MSLHQRHSSTHDEADLETTAELPVLDVMAYEASNAAVESTATTALPHIPAANLEHEGDHLSSTDSWRIPGAALGTPRPTSSDAANSVIDENRARLEINLQALSNTLRDVEERLTRKGERLAEIERALATALAERDAYEQRATKSAEEHSRAEAAVAAAQAQIAELNKSLKARDAADEERRARDTDLQTQLAQRHTEFQLQLSAIKRDFELQAHTRAQAMALLERQLEEARARATSYLETLHSNEGRRSVFEDLLFTLDGDVNDRDASITRLQTDLGTYIGRARDLETQLTERVARIAALEKQVSGLSSALAQRSELQTDVERARDGLQQTVNSLSATLAVRNERIRALEETIAQQTSHAASQRAELERISQERGQLLAGVATLESSVKAATVRGDELASAVAAAKARNEELDASLAAQRRRVEQLEAEAAAIRGELQSSSTALQAAATERTAHMARISASEARIQELEAQVSDQQDELRQLQAEAITSAARIRDLQEDLAAAEESLNRLEGEARGKSARVEELEKINQEWRATVEEARHAIKDRDSLIQRLEQETAHSAVLVGHIQRSITRLDSETDRPHPAPPVHEPAPDGATRLLIRTDGDTEVVHVLGRKTTVGRTPDNDMQIDAKFISRHHAVILAGPTHAIIEDLNSTNGVMINNRRITRQALKDGDTVMIGKTQFRYVVRPAKS